VFDLSEAGAKVVDAAPKSLYEDPYDFLAWNTECALGDIVVASDPKKYNDVTVAQIPGSSTLLPRNRTK
jgi:hypothetical protein